MGQTMQSSMQMFRGSENYALFPGNTPKTISSPRKKSNNSRELCLKPRNMDATSRHVSDTSRHMDTS